MGVDGATDHIEMTITPVVPGATVTATLPSSPPEDKRKGHGP